VCAGCKAVFTYVNDALNCSSCIDYCLISDASRVVRFSVVDEGSNLSDHLPILLECKVSNAINNSKDVLRDKSQTYLRWDHADVVRYYQLTACTCKSC